MLPNPTVADSALSRRLDRLEPSAPEASVVAAEEVQALQAGDPAPIGEGDDHRSHLHHHLREKGALFRQVVRGMKPVSLLQNLEQHIRAHREHLRPKG